MKKKFINARIYKHDDASELLVEDGEFAAIGTDLGEVDETIDLQGRFVLPLIWTHIYIWIITSLARMTKLKTNQECCLKRLIYGTTIKKEPQKKK